MLVPILRQAIDRVRVYEFTQDIRLPRARENLDLVLSSCPNAAHSSHVLHNIGKARREWLDAYLDEKLV